MTTFCRSCQKMADYSGPLLANPKGGFRLGCASRIQGCSGATVPVSALGTKLACNQCRRIKRKCNYRAASNACASCLNAGILCSLSAGSAIKFTRAAAEHVVSAALSQILSPPQAFAALNQNALSSSLSYHLFQVFLANYAGMITTYDGLASQLAKSGGKTAEMSPPSELFALCCVLQAARISNHSSILGLLAPKPVSDLQISIAYVDSDSEKFGVLRQSAVHAIRVLVKQKFESLLKGDCLQLFGNHEGRSILLLTFYTLTDQGGHQDGPEIAALVFTFVHRHSATNNGSWHTLKDVLRGISRLSAARSDYPLLPFSVYRHLFPSPQLLNPLPELNTGEADSLLLHQGIASQWIGHYQQVARESSMAITQALNYMSHKRSLFTKCWELIVSRFSSIRATFKQIVTHCSLIGPGLAEAPPGACALLKYLTNTLLMTFWPPALACCKRYPDQPTKVVAEAVGSFSGMIEQAVALWQAKENFPPWVMHEFFVDGVATCLWHTRGRVLDLWRALYPEQVIAIMPALKFASIYSAIACSLCDELAVPVADQSLLQQAKSLYISSVTTLKTFDPNRTPSVIVERALANL